MTEPVEWDFPATMRPRRRRPPPPIDGEVLEPEATPRIHRVEVTVRHRQRHSAPPAWIVPLAIIALLSMVSPYAFVVALVMLAVFASAHPVAALSVVGAAALVIVIGVTQKGRRQPF